MSESHDKLPKLFWVQLALAAIIGIIYLTTPSKHGGEHSGSENNVKNAAENLAPEGAVATQDKKAATSSGKARSGEEVYKASCQACHATGVANAPKLDDKAAWEPRVATGMEALMKTAINGKGAMPARGGNPAVTDEEIKSVILYMTGKAGFDLSSDKKPETAPDTPTTTETKTPEVEKKPVEETEVTLISAPIPPAAPIAPAAPEIAKVDVPAIAKAEEEVVPVSTDNNEEGKKIYKSSCFACHDAGVAGAPKITDKAIWAPRIATGKDVLYASALNGKGVMPPKGGNIGLSDNAVKAAVDYMAAIVQ